MEFKKTSYLILIILMLFIGAPNARAEKSKVCYYAANDGTFKASVRLTWGYKHPGWHIVEDFSKVYIDKRGATFDHNKEMIINYIANVWTNTPKNSSVEFPDIYKKSKQANASEPECPKYLVFQECGTFKVWATDSQNLASKAASEISTHKNCTGYYGSKDKEDGTPLTAEEYYSEFSYEGLVLLDQLGEPVCTDFDDMLGAKNDDGKTYDPDGDGKESLRNMLDTILLYIRIIVPIIIILLGTLDLSKAVIAGKEDAMKKAQKDFVKRILIGVAVFFVPLLVDVVMELAEIIWQGEYLICDF